MTRTPSAPLTHRASRRATVTALATLSLGLAAGFVLGGGAVQAAPDAAAKALTRAKVVALAHREAGLVVDSRAATLRVAYADRAGSAATADSALTAAEADHADAADTANHADLADLADAAEHADSADSADTADTATSATTATTADSAANATALGGKAATAYVGTADVRMRSSYSAGCNPGSSTYVRCLIFSVSVTRMSQLLLVSEVPVSPGVSPSAYGQCILLLDGNLIPSSFVYTGGGKTLLSPVLLPGAHTIEQQCNELSGDVQLTDTSVGAIGLPANDL